MDQLLAEEAVDSGTADLVQWTLADHLNTVRDIAKYDPGTDMTTVVNHLVYDAFGRVTSESDPAVDSLFLFTARPFDPDTGLQNNLNRWYDPAVGRWLSEDPIAFASGDISLYRYGNNRATTVLDPLGLWGPEIHQVATTDWAAIYFYRTPAVWVGHGDEAVDHGSTNPVIFGDWSYHFDIPTPPINVLRPFLGGDSRGRRYVEYRAQSMQALGRRDCRGAFEMLGRSLHPLQEYYAHGNWEPGLLWARTWGPHPGWYDDFSRSGNTPFLVPIRDWDDRNSTGVANPARLDMTRQHTRYALETWIADNWWAPCTCLCWIRAEYLTTRCGGRAASPRITFTVPLIAVTGATATPSGR